MTFGEKVRRLRKEKGWTQAELAKLSGLSLRTIISYEKGESYKQRKYKSACAVWHIILSGIDDFIIRCT